MQKTEFDAKIKALRAELAKDGIEVHVEDNINPEQLSCEFYKNNDALGGIYFTKGDMMLDICVSGSLDCSCFETGRSFDSDWAKSGETFEKAMDIHTDEELENTDIQYSLNNWFDVFCGTKDDMYDDQDPGILYSLEEALNADWVRKMFAKAT